MTQRNFTLAALPLTACLAVALGACQQPADDANIAIDNGANAATEVETLPPSDQASTADDGFNLTSSKDGDTSAGMPILPEDAAKATIPASYRGRWGMVPADCTSTRGDAKGLITIADKTIRFYESTATLKSQRPSASGSFAAQFGFSGEGQNWSKIVTLTRTGDTLKRADDEGNASYKRCA